MVREIVGRCSNPFQSETLARTGLIEFTENRIRGKEGSPSREFFAVKTSRKSDRRKDNPPCHRGFTTLSALDREPP